LTANRTFCPCLHSFSPRFCRICVSIKSARKGGLVVFRSVEQFIWKFMLLFRISFDFSINTIRAGAEHKVRKNSQY
uniref:Ovule protein n=1 Tax=Haemonchus placei TaxID=6290 RepID=A0A0N4WX72_HAEPC